MAAVERCDRIADARRAPDVAALHLEQAQLADSIMAPRAVLRCLSIDIFI